MIELLIAVALIGLLSAIALPSYRTYITRGKIPEATATLSLKAVKLEQYYQDNKTYTGAPDCNADTVSSKSFTFLCAASNASGYTLLATGQGSMAGFIYALNQDNAKKTIAVPSGWIANDSCWVSSAGGTC